MVHYPLSVTEGEGVELSKKYKVGKTYPVFILTDYIGDVITRWTGFTDSNRFIKQLDTALSNQRTIFLRIEQYNKRPYRDNVIFLARYYNETAEYHKSLKYWKHAKELDFNETLDYNFEIFLNSANAAWNDKIPINDAFAAADTILYVGKSGVQNTRKVIQMLTSLARKKNVTHRLGKYLQWGQKIMAGTKDKRSREIQTDFTADYALYIRKDTSEAIQIKQTSLGESWKTNPDSYYKYGKWCLVRLIDMANAEKYMRKAANKATSGKFKASVLRTLAEICDARGKTAEAIEIMNLCIENDSDDDRYDIYLNSLLDKQSSR